MKTRILIATLAALSVLNVVPLAQANPARCSSEIDSESHSRLLKASQLPLSERDWQTLEGLAANEDLPWFENKQTLSDLSTAYLPLELVEGIAQKLIAYLVESRGLDPEIEFELYDSAQINVMRQGSFIGRHYDGAIKDGEPEPFVFLLGLNSDYKGGEFLTYRGESSLVESSSKLVERSLLILNQSEYHSVNEVREGDRISIVIRVAPKSL